MGRTAVADRCDLSERIRQLRQDGWTLQAIADVLNDENVPTARGAPAWLSQASKPQPDTDGRAPDVLVSNFPNSDGEGRGRPKT